MLRNQGLADLRGRYSGECAIIANGSSLVRKPLKEVEPQLPGLDVYQTLPNWAPLAEKRRDLLALPLWSIPVPTFTVNRAWMALWPTIGHAIVEESHQRFHPGVYRILADDGKLFTAGGLWPNEPYLFTNYTTRINSERLWSEDIARDGVVVCSQICGTVTLASMQFCSYLGFNKLYLVGLDLSGPKKFSGHGVGKLEGQRQLFRDVAPHAAKAGVEIVVVGEDSMCDAFPRVKWPW